MRILFDTNVLLDVLLDRPPFADASSQLLSLAERGQVVGFCCATTLTTIFYLARKGLGTDEARRQVRLLLSILEVAPVGRAVLDSALATRMADFEEAVVAASAENAGVDLIVTRDLADFRRVPLPVQSPAEALVTLRSLEP